MCKTLEIQIRMSERSELWVGLRASEASLPPEASQVVAEGDGLRVLK